MSDTLLGEKITVPQAAKLLGVSVGVVRRLKAEGHLRGYDYPPLRDAQGNLLRRIMRIDLASVRELLASASRTASQIRAAAARKPEAWGVTSCN